MAWIYYYYRIFAVVLSHFYSNKILIIIISESRSIAITSILIIQFRYNKLCNLLKKLSTQLQGLKPTDQYRIKMTDQLLEKLYALAKPNNFSTLTYE